MSFTARGNFFHIISGAFNPSLRLTLAPTLGADAGAMIVRLAKKAVGTLVFAAFLCVYAYLSDLSHWCPSVANCPRLKTGAE
jgi:hypothetical protein